MDNQGLKADTILLSYMRPERTARDVFESMPAPVLSDLIGLLSSACSRGPVGTNVCSFCGHLHNSARYDYSRRMLMLDRAEQVRDGVWN